MPIQCQCAIVTVSPLCTENPCPGSPPCLACARGSNQRLLSICGTSNQRQASLETRKTTSPLLLHPRPPYCFQSLTTDQGEPFRREPLRSAPRQDRGRHDRPGADRVSQSWGAAAGAGHQPRPRRHPGSRPTDVGPDHIESDHDAPGDGGEVRRPGPLFTVGPPHAVPRQPRPFRPHERARPADDAARLWLAGNDSADELGE